MEKRYRMPAEWEPHEATWLSWPKDPETFPGEILKKAEEAFVRIIGELQAGERVNILVDDENSENAVRRRLASERVGMDNVSLHRIKSVDVWTRDYAPTFVKNAGGLVVAVKWIFNAWGNKYEELRKDDETGRRIAKAAGKEMLEPGIVLEGGSIETNGRGVVLTTEQCLLNRNRNPQISREQIEGYLRDYLGAKRVVWLKNGIEGDDTDGHVDDIARFVNENTILCAYEENESDANSAALKENFGILERSGFNVIKLPMPGEIRVLGRRVPASYANFYIANVCVLVPVFGDRNDAAALEIIKGQFPGRKVVGIDCREYVYGFGAIHCSTQQQPK